MLYDSKAAELVAMYGRRRVGKTFLIDEVFEDRICFRHSGLSPADDEVEKTESKRKSKMKEQLEHFHRSLIEYIRAVTVKIFIIQDKRIIYKG